MPGFVAPHLQPKPYRGIVFIDPKDARRAQWAREVDEKPRAVGQDLAGGTRYLTLLVESRPPNNLDHTGPWNSFMPFNQRQTGHASEGSVRQDGVIR